MENEIEQLQKQGHKALKTVFKGQINVNFMIEMMYDVFKLFPEYENYYRTLDGKLESAFKLDLDNFAFYEVCLHIVYVHRSNVMYLNDEDRKKLEEDKEYRKNLINKVIYQIKLRNRVQGLLIRRPLILGDRFIYMPILFDLAVIHSKCREYIAALKESKYIPLYLSLFTESLTTISLISDNLFANAYPHARAMLEAAIKLNVLKLNPNSITMFSKCIELDLQKSLGQENKKDVRTFFEDRSNKTERSLSNYLHFGWVDTIGGYHDIVKERPYSIEGLITYLDSRSGQRFSNLTGYYKLCHGYVHGSNLGHEYPLFNLLELSVILTNGISELYKFTSSETNDVLLIDGIDVADSCYKEFLKVIEQYRHATEENLKEYYKKYFPIFK